MLMTHDNPNCDGSHCRPGYKEVCLYPPVPSTGSGGGHLYLCLPCFANDKETGKPEDWPQVHWSTAVVAYDNHGAPARP
jgi:hypothetical protein